MTEREKIIKLFKLAGYDFIEKNPPERLLFHDESNEREIQLWLKPGWDNLSRAMNLILNITHSNGISLGRSEVQTEIKNALGL